MAISLGYVLVSYGCRLHKVDLVSKPNILINDDGRACLAGFSLLTAIPDELTAPSNSHSNATQRIGGVQWSAPEVLKGGAPGKEADIFSFAMMMIEVRRGWPSGCQFRLPLLLPNAGI